MPRIHSLYTGAILLIIATALSSCDQSIDPIIGEDRPFTIWGYLDAHAKIQRVRVFPIRDQLLVDPDHAGPIDATVTSNNLTTGEVYTWVHIEDACCGIPRDSIGGYLFEAEFSAEYENRYRLSVRRSDGAESSAEVTIPPPVEVELIDERNRVIVPVHIHGKPPNLVDVAVTYDAITLPPANPWPPGSTTPPAVRLPVEIPYSGKEEPLDDGWRYEINLREDFDIVQEQFEINCLSRDHIALRRIYFRFLAADEQWAPPNDSFDPVLLIEPGTFSNVENGYGFFGGGYTVTTAWIPTEVILRNIGYRTAGPCPLSPQNIPECQLPPEPCLEQGS
ncbi:MAG: hypothetical protein OXI05_13050 [Bacteroidota bacterium]|nr:hypothetical protein [Bacteroidota bacterium]